MFNKHQVEKQDKHLAIKWWMEIGNDQVFTLKISQTTGSMQCNEEFFTLTNMKSRKILIAISAKILKVMSKFLSNFILFFKWPSWLSLLYFLSRRFQESRYIHSEIQRTMTLVMCQRFGDLFLFGLIWQYSTNQKQYNKGRFKVMATYLQQ